MQGDDIIEHLIARVVCHIWVWGANTVKYTTPSACIGSSESDSKLYTNVEFCEGKNHKQLKKHIDLQNQAIYVDYFKKM
jgi:hypothetical protein